MVSSTVPAAVTGVGAAANSWVEARIAAYGIGLALVASDVRLIAARPDTDMIAAVGSGKLTAILPIGGIIETLLHRGRRPVPTLTGHMIVV
jgi:hypothetical protein